MNFLLKWTLHWYTFGIGYKTKKKKVEKLAYMASPYINVLNPVHSRRFTWTLAVQHYGNPICTMYMCLYVLTRELELSSFVCLRLVLGECGVSQETTVGMRTGHFFMHVAFSLE